MGDSATIQLLETLSEHSVRWRDADFEEFKGLVEASLAKLRAGEEAGDLAGQVAKYQRETQQQIEASLAELHDMIRVLLSAIEQAQGNPEEAGAALDRVANAVQSARTAEELQTAREELSKLLSEMAPGSPGAARPKSEGAAKPESKQMATDPATGLPGKDAAVAALESMEAEHREHSFLVMLYVQRMELVTARFGETFGGQVLFFCAQHIARLMHPEDQLFRWRGPAFVALLRRDVSLVEVRQEVLRACGSRIMFESANNSVLLPINMSVQVVHVDSTPVPELLGTVESFLTNPNARR